MHNYVQHIYDTQTYIPALLLGCELLRIYICPDLHALLVQVLRLRRPLWRRVPDQVLQIAFHDISTPALLYPILFLHILEVGHGIEAAHDSAHGCDLLRREKL